MTVNSWMGSGRGRDRRIADGEVLVASRSAFPFLNAAFRTRSGDSADGLIDRARSFFLERRRGFVVYAWPGDPEIETSARSAGMSVELDRYPEMVCRARLTAPPGDVRPVESAADAEAYWSVCDAAYPSLDFPSGLFREAFEPEDLLDRQRSWACVAYQGGGRSHAPRHGWTTGWA